VSYISKEYAVCIAVGHDQTFADACGQATYPCSTYAHVQICCTIYPVCKISILSSVEINSSYSSDQSSDALTIQTDTGSSCALISDQSDTWIPHWRCLWSFTWCLIWTVQQTTIIQIFTKDKCSTVKCPLQSFNSHLSSHQYWPFVKKLLAANWFWRLFRLYFPTISLTLLSSALNIYPLSQSPGYQYSHKIAYDYYRSHDPISIYCFPLLQSIESTLNRPSALLLERKHWRVKGVPAKLLY